MTKKRIKRTDPPETSLNRSSATERLHWQRVKQKQEQLENHASLLRAEMLLAIDDSLRILAPQIQSGSVPAIAEQRALLRDAARLLSLYPHEQPQTNKVIVVEWPLLAHRQLDDGNTIENVE